MGKFSLVYILGLSLIVAYGIWNINLTGTASLDAYSAYYGRTMAHNIAVAGANVATQMLLRSPATVADHSGSFSFGTYDVHYDKGGDSAAVTVHSEFAVSGGTIYDTVVAKFQYTPFAKFGWFTETENNGYNGGPFYGANDWKITGDSVFGFAHTNNHFNLGGAPYFHDKVTATNAPALMAVNGVMAPIFRAGYQWGITIGRPGTSVTNLEAIATASSSLIDVNKDVSLEFLSNGTVHVEIPPTSGALRNDTLSLTTLAPDGVIMVRNGDLRVKGTYSGQVTVGALKGSSTNKGNVWIDGDGIVAADDPRYNPSSTDMMGIVSEGSTYITRDDSRTPSSLVTIEASVYCYNGELTAEQFWVIGLSGRVNLYGGVIQKTAGSLGVFTGGGLVHGLYYSIRHDPRFNSAAPPHFPLSDKYELVSWWEN